MRDRDRIIRTISRVVLCIFIITSNISFFTYASEEGNAATGNDIAGITNEAESSADGENGNESDGSAEDEVQSGGESENPGEGLDSDTGESQESGSGENQETGSGDGSESENPEPEDPPVEPCNHVWGSWKTTVSPTYFNVGIRTRTCTLCNDTESATINKKTAYRKWITYKGCKYYFNSKSNPSKGWQLIYTSNSKKGSKRWCYFNKDGKYKTSVKKKTKSKWVYADGKKFYFNKKCKPLAKGFHFVKGKLYYMDAYGAVTIGTFTAPDGNTYTTNKRGEISGLMYYKHKYKNFILLDISDQKLYLYKNKKKVMTFNVVTGRKGSYDTPTGVYKIGAKKRNVSLTGPTWSTKVKYWMPFIGASYGFHDASWRSASEFASNTTYIRNGSHGCVNMNTKSAKTLYDNVYKGLTVIIVK